MQHSIFDELKMQLFDKTRLVVGYTSIKQLHDVIILYGTCNVLAWQNGIRHGLTPIEFTENLRILSTSHWANKTLGGLITEIMSRHIETQKSITAEIDIMGGTILAELVVMKGESVDKGITPNMFSKTLFIIVDHFFTII